MKVKATLIIGLLIYQNSINAQQPLFYLNFDDFNFNETTIPKEKAYYVVDLQQSQFEKGLTGRALDLSANAILRRPVKLDKGTLPELTEKTSFSVQVWVKTLPHVIMGTPLIGNKKVGDLSTAGWQIYTQERSHTAVTDGRKYCYRTQHTAL